MSKDVETILFEDILPIDALNITTGNGYPITIIDFFNGAISLQELTNIRFKYPLMSAFRLTSNTTERDAEFDITRRELTVHLFFYKKSDLLNAESDARTMLQTGRQYLDSNNGICKISGTDGIISNYLIVSDDTFTIPNGNIYYAIAHFEIKLFINK